MKNYIQLGKKLTIELVLDDIVEDLEKEEDKVIISMICKQEPWCRERLKRYD